MSVPFVKMSGAGNDMILVDHREEALRGREAEFARFVCHRRLGVGADALILLEASGEADFSIRFFNPDGSEYGLCGNGARCVPRFAHELGFAGPDYEFVSKSGRHRGRVLGPDSACVDLPPVRSTRLDIPVELEGESRTVDFGDIGVPHAVLWVPSAADAPVERWGPLLRHAGAFTPEGTNISFAERVTPGRLKLRTFERGVEGETWACGSGSAVVATIARERGWIEDSVEMQVRSGEVLRLRVGKPGTPPVLEGAVTRICAGTADFPAPVGQPGAEAV